MPRPNYPELKGLTDMSRFRAMRKAPGIVSLSVKGDAADLLLYDVIGLDDTAASTVVAQLNSLPLEVKNVLVRINSPGGDVFDGIAIMNALFDFDGTVNVQVDGLCASIASVIAMAGKRVTMAATAQLMIHNPWTLAIGDARDLRSIADKLDMTRETSMIPAYRRSGKSVKDIVAIMDAETWYTAAEAKAAGWVDTVRELPGVSPAARNQYDLRGFAAVQKGGSRRDDFAAECKRLDMILGTYRPVTPAERAEYTRFQFLELISQP